MKQEIVVGLIIIGLTVGCGKKGSIEPPRSGKGPQGGEIVDPGKLLPGYKAFLERQNGIELKTYDALDSDEKFAFVLKLNQLTGDFLLVKRITVSQGNKNKLFESYILSKEIKR